MIAIAGISGSGKTSVVRALAERTGGRALHFDDWADDPPDTAEWGARVPVAFGRWRTPELCEALAELRAGREVRLPDRKETVAPAPLLIVEEPFGRLRPDIAPLLDEVVCLALPLHLALARRLSRQLRALEAGFGSAAELAAFLDIYGDWGHSFYTEQDRQLRETSDRCYDARRPVAELVAEIAGDLGLA